MTEEAAPAPGAGGLARWGWPALVVAVALVAMRGCFSLSEIFYDRDLAAYYWPQLLWLRATVFSGHAPLWDPYVAFGQPAIVDPVRQLFFFPTLPLRLLLPEVVGFNLTVAFPYPLAGIGMYLYLRRHASRPAAALGAIALVLSGPFLSLGNMVNNSTTAAFVPWALWGVDRLLREPTTRSFGALALVFALQALAGEAVTLAATGALALAYAAAAPPAGRGWGARARPALLTLGAGLAGALLAAVQLVPTLAAVGGSDRGTGRMDDGWSVHPLSLAETVLPAFFGDPFVSWAEWSPWIEPLNSMREPYLMSVYLGAALLVVALLGATASPRRRWVAFWCAVFVVAVVFALGYNLPVYGLVRSVVAPMQTFRFPGKYAVFAVVALAALAAAGFDALRAARGAGWRYRAPVAAAAALAGLAAVPTAVALAAPELARGALAGLAAAVDAQPAAAAAEVALASLELHGPRLVALALAVAAMLWVGLSDRPAAPYARAALFALVATDLLVYNSALNPTMRADLLRDPAWAAVVREHPADRVYVGRGDSFVAGAKPLDTPPVLVSNPRTPAMAVKALWSVVFSTMPSGWGVRESISRDLSRLRPVEYTRMLEQLQRGGGEARGRFLSRTATRFYLLAAPPVGGYRLAAPLPEIDPIALYELETPGPRAFVATRAAIEPDLALQTARMMSADLDPYAEVLLAAEPPPAAGSPGPARAAAAEIVEESPNGLLVRASVPEAGGYLVLMDSYAPGWRAEIDGAAAEVVRADGLFRAVRLAGGERLVRLVYRPPSLYAGAAVSLLAALALLALSARPSRLSVQNFPCNEKSLW